VDDVSNKEKIKD